MHLQKWLDTYDLSNLDSVGKIETEIALISYLVSFHGNMQQAVSPS